MSDPELLKLYYYDETIDRRLKLQCPICNQFATIGKKNFKAIEIAEKLLEIEKKNNENKKKINDFEETDFLVKMFFGRN